MSHSHQPEQPGQQPHFDRPSGSGGVQQPPPPGTPQGQAPPFPKRRRWFLSAPFVGAVTFVVGLIFGGIGAGGTAAEPATIETVAVPGPTVIATATQTVTATATATVTATKTVKAKPKPQPTKTVTVTAAPVDGSGGAPTSEIGDGTYLVGTEIEIGNYKSSGSDSPLCYADTQTEGGEILEQELSNGEPVVMRITEQAYTFTSNDCGTWRKVG